MSIHYLWILFFTLFQGTHYFNFVPSGYSIDQRPVCIDSYSGSLTSSKRRDYFLSEHFDLCSSTVLMQLPNANLHHGPTHQQSDRRPSVEEGEATDCGRPHECLAPCNTFMGRSWVNQLYRTRPDVGHTLVWLFLSSFSLRNIWESSLEASQGPVHRLRPALSAA